MPRKSGTLASIENFIDDATEYLMARRAAWKGGTSPNTGKFELKNMGRNYSRKDVEAFTSEEDAVLANHLDLEAFAVNGWNREDTVVAFGSFVHHPDKGPQVAVLIGGKPTSMTLESLNSPWGKKALVLCVA